MSSLRINTNSMAMSALHKVSDHNRMEEETQMKLASSDRIYKAAIDPAGLAISEKLRSTSASQMQAKLNINQGVALFQTAESSIGTVQDLAIRLKEMATKSSSDTFDPDSRALQDIEFQQIKNEIERVAGTSSYNGLSLINGNSGGDYHLQVGTNNSAKNDRLTYKADKVNMTLSGLGIAKNHVSTKEGAQQSMIDVSRMLDKLSLGRSEIGSVLKRLETAMQSLDESRINTAAGNSRIRDADIAVETANQSKASIQKNAATSTLVLANDIGKRVMRLLS